MNLTDAKSASHVDNYTITSVDYTSAPEGATLVAECALAIAVVKSLGPSNQECEIIALPYILFREGIDKSYEAS